MRLILLGAPGAGKGTQAERISKAYNIPTISTGNLLRAAVAAGSELGVKAKAFMENGSLVPDELVVNLLKERLTQADCEGGFILDGFPRNLQQAKTLDEMGVEIDKVLSLEVDDEEIVARLSGRRVCLTCGATYHIEHMPPKKEDICDKCGEKLIVRDDDKTETVMKRLDTFHIQTEPLKEYYLATGKLKIVIGQENVEDTAAETMKALQD